MVEREKERLRNIHTNLTNPINVRHLCTRTNTPIQHTDAPSYHFSEFISKYPPI